MRKTTHVCEWTPLFSLLFRVACVCLLILLIFVCVCMHCLFRLVLLFFFFLFLVCVRWLVIFISFFFFLLLYSLLFRSNTVQNFEKKTNNGNCFSLYVKAKYMFDQYQSSREYDNREFRVYQERYEHNRLYDIPN